MNVAAQRRQEGHHLTFLLAGEQYAISIRRVREIIEFDSVRPVPGTPRDVRGVINLRGAVVPVVDLALKFGLDRTPVTKDTCIIILEVLIDGEPGSMGVMTEAVSEVLDLRSDDIEPPPAFGTQVHVDYLLGMAMIDGKMALVLDIDEVLQTSSLVPPEQPDSETAEAPEAKSGSAEVDEGFSGGDDVGESPAAEEGARFERDEEEDQFASSDHGAASGDEGDAEGPSR
jgi:purine-binding chemotaxis protein CheW